MNLLTASEFEEFEAGEVELIPTGCSVITSTVGGLMEGGIHLVAGATGSGKSMFLLHSAIQVAKANPNKTVFYISFENDPRIDKSRFVKALDTYHIESSTLDNLYFVLGASESDDMFKKSSKPIVALAKEKSTATLSDLFDTELAKDNIFFIDGAEYQMSSAKEGSELFEQGQKLMAMMSKCALKNNACIICSWQLVRGTNDKKIEKLSCDDISMSIAVARIATTIWAIKKTGDSWGIINIKSRQEVLEEPRAFSLYDRNHNFTVKCQTPTFSKKNN